MSKKRIFTALMCVIMLLTLLTACGGTGGDGEKNPGEKVKVVYWHTYSDQHEQALQEIIATYNESQDQYELVAEQQPYNEFNEKLMQAVRNGTGPDIVNMFPSDAINYFTEDLLVDFAPFINDPEIGLPNFRDNMSAGQYAELTQWGEEHIYFFPCTTVGEVLFYNKSMFDKYDLQAPETWDDVEKYSKLIFENEGIPGFGTDSVTDTYQCLIKQAGSGYIDAANMSMDIDEAIAIEQLNWFADGVKEGYFRLVGEDVFFSNPFGSQAVASYIGSSAGVSYVEAAVGDAFEMGCVPIPQQGPEKYISQWGNNMVCLSTDDASARGAYDFIKHFTSAEVVVDWAIGFGSVPVFKDAAETDEFQVFAQSNMAIKALNEELEYVGMLPSVLGANNVRTEIDKMVQNVALGVMDAQAAFDVFITAAQAALGK